MARRVRITFSHEESKVACRDKGPTVILAGMLGILFKSDTTSSAVGSAALIVIGLVLTIYGFANIEVSHDA